ncbi:MAG TPA: chemotaxis protein CheW, partial [Syntrophomonadaceae bacterium]|nr:chemotaxis protein CheW [Syntrophomonadaceae bacterium]
SDIDKKKVGIIVDEVLEVLRVSQRYIEGAPEICQDNKMQKYLEGIANLNDRMIMMLDLQHVLQENEWQKLAEISEPGKTQPKANPKLKKQGRSS